MTPDLARLEYDRVLAAAAAFAGSGRGAALISSLEPAWSPAASDRLRDLTVAAREVMETCTSFPGRVADDLGEAVESLGGGAVTLEPRLLRSTGEALRSIAGFLGKAAEFPEGAAAVLSPLAGSLPDLPGVAAELLRITTPDGGISPDASPLLARLNRSAARLRDSLSKTAARLAGRYASEGVARDAPPTMRNGRFVIGVPARSRTALRGLVHDRSESGNTLFIEPGEMIEPGNMLQETLVDIAQEERRILREATAALRERLDLLSRGAAASAELDAAFAMACFHAENDTVFPERGRFSLPGARHPLIPRSESVPNDLVLPEDWKVVVLSGPNAGGKTVLVKTAGLAVCCAQSGLGACAGPGSTLPFFERVLVSIGDRQSISERLSTYSARLVEELGMLETSGPGTLVIIDEPAAGTDPLPGSALAAALLEALASRGASVITTTHLGQLKALASWHEGFYNASMNFDEAHLQPDYRFRFGIPGSSFTFEIADRLGFPPEVTARARDLSGDAFRLESLIAELGRTLESLEAERTLTRERARETDELMASLESMMTLQEEEAGRLRAESAERAERLLSELNSRADSLLARLSSPADPDAKAARKAIRELSSLVPESPDRPVGTRAGRSPERGDRVTVRGWRGSGVVEEVRDDTVVVRMGSIAVERPAAEVIPAPDAPVKKAGDPVSQYDLPAPPPDLDLRGMSSEEAVAEIDLRIDACVASGLNRLRIIHGKGRGILMKAVLDYLSRDRRVSSSAVAEPHEGGTGVTICILKSGRRQGGGALG